MSDPASRSFVIRMSSRPRTIMPDLPARSPLDAPSRGLPGWTPGPRRPPPAKPPRGSTASAAGETAGHKASAMITMGNFSEPPGPDARPEVRCRTEPSCPAVPTPDLALYSGVLISPTRDRNGGPSGRSCCRRRVLISPTRDRNTASGSPSPTCLARSSSALRGIATPGPGHRPSHRPGVLISPTRDRNAAWPSGRTRSCSRSSSALRGIATRAPAPPGTPPASGPHPPYEGSQRGEDDDLVLVAHPVLIRPTRDRNRPRQARASLPPIPSSSALRGIATPAPVPPVDAGDRRPHSSCEGARRAKL